MPTYAVTDKQTNAVRYVEAVRVESAINYVVAERFTAERIKIESVAPVDPMMSELRELDPLTNEQVRQLVENMNVEQVQGGD